MAVDYVSVQDVALSTGYSDKTIIRWIKNGRLPYVRLARRYLIPTEAYNEFIRENTHPAPEGPISSDSGQGSSTEESSAITGQSEPAGSLKNIHINPNHVYMVQATEEGIKRVMPYVRELLNNPSWMMMGGLNARSDVPGKSELAEDSAEPEKRPVQYRLPG